MSIQTIQEFIQRHNPAAAGLAALGATLDARASGQPLEPSIAAAIEELLGALGGADLLAGVTAEEAVLLSAEVGHQVRMNAKLLRRETLTSSWSYADDQLLQDVGTFARGHARGLVRMVVPALDGLADRFAAPGATFLDIGVGVGGLAVEFATLLPTAKVVGIDVFQPALALARANVAAEALGDRIELREQAAEALEDDQAFDLAWIPMPFMPGRILPAATARTLKALRPGGWAVFAMVKPDLPDATSAAFWRLRATTWGGPRWSTDQVETMAREQGFTSVRTLPGPPASPVALVVGRRAPG